MTLLRLENVTFEGYIEKHPPTYAKILLPFTQEFVYGQSYLLTSQTTASAWAISWMIGGIVEPIQGVVTKNNAPFAIASRRREAWCVRKSEIKTLSIGGATVCSQIRHGLRNSQYPFLMSEAEIVGRFRLSPERYKRRLDKLSHEAWRASCAIGLAQGRKIFCFPYLDAVLIETYYDLWLKEIITILCESGALVLIPTRLTSIAVTLGDQIVNLGDYFL